jgi:capsular polysaccharide biosynthesis protein
MHCAGDLSQVYLNEIRSSGDDATGEAGVITAREVDVSFPIGMHLCAGRVFAQALLADYVLVNPKYVIDLERLPLRRKRTGVSEAVLLTLPWHHNFYHWMVEILPRLSLCDSLPELQGLPLLVARSSPRFVRESLALTGYLDRALFLDDGAYRFEKLHFPTRLAPASQASPLAVEWLRRKVPPSPPSHPVRRLYVSRRDAKIRRVTNEAEVEAALADLGFVTVVPSEHGLSRQAELFRNADIVVGSHGAAFANLAFSKAGTAVIEVFEPGHFNPAYTRIAAINRLRYAFLAGRKSALGISIDVPQLRQMVVGLSEGLSRAA